MSSSDDPDTNTSDKCVSEERNRERERDSGVVCVLVMWSHIDPSPLHAGGRPLFWLNKTNKTGYYTNSYHFKGKIWQSDNSWYKVSKIFNGISSGRANLFFLLTFASTLVQLVYSLPSTSIKLNFINLHLSPQFILVNKGVNEETARRSSAAFQYPGVALLLLQGSQGGHVKTSSHSMELYSAHVF